MSEQPGSKNFAFTLLKFRDRYIFQHRDDRPDIVSPGLFAGFGGMIEQNEEPLEAARRELAEETSIDADNLEIKLLGEVAIAGKDGVRYAFAAEIGTDEFEVYEGQGKVSFTKEEVSSMDLDKFTPSTKASLERWVL